jgi:hypothetical protein
MLFFKIKIIKEIIFYFVLGFFRLFVPYKKYFIDE